MPRTTAPAAVEQLTARLFDGAPADELADEMTAWLAGSPRFRAFVHANADKIRKKLRGSADPEARRDVRAELRVAQLLLQDQRIELAFEAYGSGKVGPDFTVTIRGERGLNIEVTRLRRPPGAADVSGLLLAKLRQMASSVPNALLVAIDGDSAEALDIAGATRTLRARADRKDEAFFECRGLKGTRGFYERYLRLGAVLIWCEGAVDVARATLWANRSARIAVPERAVRACLACLRAR
jgi:hypothetical protein